MRSRTLHMPSLWRILVPFVLFFACNGPLVAAQFQSPPTPLWHFAVRSADNAMVTIIFSKDFKTPSGSGPFPIERYTVEKSDTSAFTDTTEIPGPYADVGTSYLASDAGFVGNDRPYYRVRITGKNGTDVAQSTPFKVYDQAGNTFVVNNFPQTPGSVCGDILTNPCPDIRAALDTATPGSSIYLTPGIYSGAGNTNITLGGKAITLSSTNGRDITLINCTDPVSGKRTRAFNFINGQGRDTVVEGITMALGAADLGGCVYIEQSSPIIRNSAFVACNSTTGSALGGAAYVSSANTPGPLFENNNFIFNWAVEGGALHLTSYSNATVDGCFFQWNICPTGVGRGATASTIRSNITMTNSYVENSITGYGSGGLQLQDKSYGYFNNFTLTNCTAGNWGAAFVVFGSEMTIENSNITGNSGLIFSGGALVSNGNYYSYNTIYANNYGRLGSGALKLLGGKMHIKGGSITGNYAGKYGAAFDITSAVGDASSYTELIVQDVLIANNIADDTGAVAYLDAFDYVEFNNTIIRNNTAARGGAIYCYAKGTAIFRNTTFEDNVAQIGGAIFNIKPCGIELTDSVLRRNIAINHGGAIALGDGVSLSSQRCLFESNGQSSCGTSSKPPKDGGAIMVGVQPFQVGDKCDKSKVSRDLSVVNLTDTTFVGNLALEKGGAVSLENGIVNMDGCEFEGNKVVGAEATGDGAGGAVAVDEFCDDSGCSTAIARVNNCTFVDNWATTAGGALHYAGGSELGSLMIIRSNISGNAVEHDVSKPTAGDGVGGGMYLGRNNFTVSDVSFSGNDAYYGGAIFFSTNLSSSVARLTKIRSANNRAVLGSAAYWLRSESSDNELPLSAFTITPNDNASVATEVLTTSLTSTAPKTVQSGEESPDFSVAMLDYYGNVGVSELGTCAVAAPYVGIAANSSSTGTTAEIRPQGSDSGITRGSTVFSQLQVTGTIGDSYILQVDCTPNALGRSRYLHLNGTTLPPLSLPVTIAPCAPGKEPKNTGTGSICVDCAYGSYNTDGIQCLPCPDGAVCSGGDQIASKANYWRSNYQSDQFYSCRSPDVCNAGPVVADAACVDGNEGPLCAVCENDYFAFAGKCQSCNKTAQAKAMISIAAILLAAVIVFIFAKGLEFGDPSQPGIMTKVKILLTHFQLLALFKDYDVLWPSATSRGFAWFDTLNFGMSMMAPECFFHGYSFWSRWIFQMFLPVGAVGLCYVVYRGATWYERRYLNINTGKRSSDDTEEEGASTSGASTTTSGANSLDERQKKRAEYIAGLKIRTWKNAFWLVTLLYPRSSMTSLQMFSTQTLVIGTYLTADYSIQVKPPGGGYTSLYIRYMVPGALMLIVFAIFIPFTWFWVTWKNRKNLDDPLVAKKYGFLYGSYSRRLPFWETVETVRKFAFAFVPVFIKQNSVGSVQGTVGQILIVGFLIASVWLRPFAMKEDNHLMIASQVVLFLVLLSGCTAKWANLDNSGLKGLAAAQLILSSGLAFGTIAALVLSIKAKIKQSKEAKAAAAAAAGEEDNEKGGKKQKSKFFTLNVHAGGVGANEQASTTIQNDGGDANTNTNGAWTTKIARCFYGPDMKNENIR